MTNVHCTQDADVGETTEMAAGEAVTMRAIAQDRYGSSSVLQVTERPVPQVEAGRVLVRVDQAALNPLDWHMMTGMPWFLRLTAGFRAPKVPVRGVDLAGEVVQVGDGVDDIAVGARVFGGGAGAFADYASCKATHIAPMPATANAAQAAAMPVAAVTALQGLRDHGAVGPGTTVLINGAAGGVGTYAVQIAKHLGADVTAVCSRRNVDMVRALGADTVVDYTGEDVLDLDRRFDVILDNVGNRSLSDVRRLLTDEGVLVAVSGPKTNRLLGPAARMVAAMARFAIGKQRAVMFTAKETREELEFLADLFDRGELRSEIERSFPLAQTAEAIDYLATGHARSKLIIDVAGSRS